MCLANTFGIPAEDDPDPFGVKALEAEGLNIREAGTHQRPSAEAFEFRPSPTSPIYAHFNRQSVDGSIRSRTWRDSTHSLASINRGTQTDEDESKSTDHSPRRDEKRTAEVPRKHSQLVNEDDDQGNTRSESFSDVDSDAEISTAVPVMAKARMVDVPKRPAPALPPRNPERVVSPVAVTEPSSDGFDRISLNAGDERGRREDGRSPSPARTNDAADGTFHSVPGTPVEEKKSNELPGSFNQN